MNIGNDLALVVGRHVVDLVADVHVPVNAFGRAGGGISAASLDDHADLAQGVGFIVGVVREDFELPAVEFLRPMALLASFLCRAQIVHGCRNGPRVGIEYRRKNLPAARKF